MTNNHFFRGVSSVQIQKSKNGFTQDVLIAPNILLNKFILRVIQKGTVNNRVSDLVKSRDDVAETIFVFLILAENNYNSCR